MADEQVYKAVKHVKKLPPGRFMRM